MEAGICTGQTDAHIEYRELRDHTGDKRPVGLQPKVWRAFDEMRNTAANAGIDLLIASGFRDFDRQLHIWNGKADGSRPLFDQTGLPLDVSALSELEVCEAILRWSALPGASRHHWGTDLDVYDGMAIDHDYALQLTPDEYAVGGPFNKLSNWLSEHAAQFDFARPYQVDTGGIAPEPWHISYLPLATTLQNKLTVQVLQRCLDGADMRLSESVMNQLDALHDRFINIAASADAGACARS